MIQHCFSFRVSGWLCLSNVAAIYRILDPRLIFMASCSCVWNRIFTILIATRHGTQITFDIALIILHLISIKSKSHSNIIYFIRVFSLNKKKIIIVNLSWIAIWNCHAASLFSGWLRSKSFILTWNMNIINIIYETPNCKRARKVVME